MTIIKPKVLFDEPVTPAVLARALRQGRQRQANARLLKTPPELKPSFLPQLLVHSDLHLGSGPFTLPMPSNAGARPTIVVIAGDTDDGENTMASLRAMSELPTVAIAGNHDFYGADYFERLAQLRASAQSHGIHFLENDAVRLNGVRFLGATLWTDYCGANETLMDYGLWGMNDHHHIKAARWWTLANKKRFLNAFGLAALEKFEGNFNPLLQIELHRKTKQFLARMAREVFAGPTVLVTHHAPSQQSLLRAGIHKESLEPSHWTRRRDDDLQLARVGSYATPLIENRYLGAERKPSKHERRAEVRDLGASLWVHGHLHQAMDYGLSGLRMVCNPRGRIHAPHTKESALAFRFWGYPISEEEILKSQQRHAENPEVGDGQGYDKSKVVDLLDPCYAWVQEKHLELMENLSLIQSETRTLAPLAGSKRADVARLAAFRLDTLRERVIHLVKAFLVDMIGQHNRYRPGQKDLESLLEDAKLMKWNQRFMPENTVNYEGLVDWYAHMEEDPNEKIESRPKIYASEFGAELRQLIKVLAKAPQACEKLRQAYLKTF